MAVKTELAPEEAKAWLQAKSGMMCFLSGEAKGLKGEALRRIQDKFDRLAVETSPKLAAIAAKVGTKC